jgi:septum formation protein
MLSRLSGQKHQVVTGFCLYNSKRNKICLNSVSTHVRFKPLSQREIKWYVKTKEPFDKAGGYGIQGLGAFMVQHISGSYSNVVGLPVCEVIQMLMDEHIIQL